LADIIQQLICHFRLDIADIAKCRNINFDEEFTKELVQLKAMEADGLLSLKPNAINILNSGWLLVRNFCISCE
jgi:oxygen-independent coproporphyrinogen-3 oxidase